MTTHSRPFTRRSALATIGGGAFALSIGLQSRKAGAQMKEINFVTPFGYLIGFAPTLYGVSGGFFEKEGLDVTIQGGKGSAMAVQQVLGKQAMFSRTGGVDLIRAAHGQGAPLTSIATVTQASPMFMISAESAPIQTPEDMLDKTIGVTSNGGLAENLLDMILEDNGIDSTTVNREAVGNAPGAFGLVQQGKVDAYIASMGTVVKLKADGLPIVTWNTDKFAPIPGQVYVAHNEDLESDPDTIVAFLRAVNGAMNALFEADDLTPILESMRMFEVRDLADLETAETALRAEMDLYAAEGQENLLRNVPERWQGAMDRMAKTGLVEPGDASDYYTNEFLDKAKA